MPAISILRIIAEKSINHGKDVFVAFVDYEKGFERVEWPKMMEILEMIGVNNYRERKIIWKLYTKQTAMISID